MDIDTKRDRHLPGIADEHWDVLNGIRKAHKETWAETFERLSNYQDWVGHLFNLPRETSEIAIINASTVMQLLPQWLENVHLNFIKDAEIPDIREIENSVEQGTPGLVIGAGPSLRANNHLDMLRDSAFYKEHKGVIISVANNIKECLDSGIVPDYMVLIDGDPIITPEFIDHNVVDDHCKDITAIFSVTVPPAAAKRWKGDVHYFMPVIPDMTIPNAQAVISGLFPNVTEMDAMANCGSFAWNVARYVGCNPIALIGLDFAFKPETPIKDTWYWEQLRASCSSDKETIETMYRFQTHSFFGTNCFTDIVYGSFGVGSMETFKAYKKRDGIITQNCTEGGIIDDPDIENMWFRDWLAKWE
jgi:hypothetical protein